MVVVRHRDRVLEQWAVRTPAEAKDMIDKALGIDTVVAASSTYVADYRGRRYSRVIL